MIWTRKQFEREMERRMIEADRERWQNERIDRMQRQIDDLREQLFDLRIQLDPDFQKKHTPVCGSETTCCPAP